MSRLRFNEIRRGPSSYHMTVCPHLGPPAANPEANPEANPKANPPHLLLVPLPISLAQPPQPT